MAENATTIQEVFESVMSDLGNPTASQLNPTIVWQKLLDAIQYYLNAMGNRSRSVLLVKKNLNILRDIEDYPLNDVQDYSEGLFIEVVPTELIGGVNRRILPIIDLANTAFSGVAYGTRGGAFIVRDNATNQLTLRIRPIPSTDYTAVLWYKPTRIQITGMTTPLVAFEQFYSNIAKRAALAALPHCDYKADMKKDIRDGLREELASHDVNFDYFILQGSNIGGEKRPARNMRDDGY